MALEINGKRLDDLQRPYIIAEASGNHNQEYATAEALIRAAAVAGADAIKFQTFTAEEICADIPLPFGMNAQHDAWLRELGVSRMRELFAKGGLPRDWHVPLKAVAEAEGLAFLSTPFSVDAARFLVEDVGVPALKIASGDLTFEPLIRYAGSTGLVTILSTGGATLEEIGQAETWFDDEEAPISYDRAGWQRLAILHCLSVYPCDVAIVNLRSIEVIKARILCDAVGFSDHTLSSDLIPALAVSCGATILEKHLKLSDDYSSVDCRHSLAPESFAQYVRIARLAPEILGAYHKKPHALESHDRLWARRDPRDWLRPTHEAREGRWA